MLCDAVPVQFLVCYMDILFLNLTADEVPQPDRLIELCRALRVMPAA
jgi:hypothetical protein